MDNYLDWLNLGLRWLHVVVAVAWIGASFYFNWLLNRLTAPQEPDELVQGELWAIHAGGFFRVQKRSMPPGVIPAPLHWFKWEAYWTWISGFALLVLMYYVQADRYLIDPSVADLSVWQVVAIGLATIFIGTGVYDGLWRSKLANRPRMLSVLCCILLVAVAYGLTLVFSGRGAFMHVGALIGTIMVANVAHVIMPSQRQLISATLAGETPDPALSRSAGLRSLHNNYLTLPVIFVMLSSHYPATFGHSVSWLVLLALFACSVFIRHFFNVRWQRGDRRSLWLLVVGVIGFAALAVLVLPSASRTSTSVSFDQVQAVISKRCVQCHAQQTKLVAKAGKGVMLETPEQIATQASAIYAQSVLSRAMPLGNLTQMTDDERLVISSWYAAGAKID
jgi:uncharacterized membrane protein